MIEKFLTALEDDRKQCEKASMLIRSLRQRLEIELGGLQARHDHEIAECLRVRINECHDSEFYFRKRCITINDTIIEIQNEKLQDDFLMYNRNR